MLTLTLFRTPPKQPARFKKPASAEDKLFAGQTVAEELLRTGRIEAGTLGMGIDVELALQAFSMLHKLDPNKQNVLVHTSPVGLLKPTIHKWLVACFNNLKHRLTKDPSKPQIFLGVATNENNHFIAFEFKALIDQNTQVPTFEIRVIDSKGNPSGPRAETNKIIMENIAKALKEVNFVLENPQVAYTNHQSDDVNCAYHATREAIGRARYHLGLNPDEKDGLVFHAKVFGATEKENKDITPFKLAMVKTIVTKLAETDDRYKTLDVVNMSVDDKSTLRCTKKSAPLQATMSSKQPVAESKGASLPATNGQTPPAATSSVVTKKIHDSYAADEEAMSKKKIEGLINAIKWAATGAKQQYQTEGWSIFKGTDKANNFALALTKMAESKDVSLLQILRNMHTHIYNAHTAKKHKLHYKGTGDIRISYGTQFLLALKDQDGLMGIVGLAHHFAEEMRKGEKAERKKLMTTFLTMLDTFIRAQEAAANARLAYSKTSRTTPN